ncbi:MAG TPA: twin-arginine translocation signal domain-containing protein, partial [Gemmatimonadaceae bacterium]
MTDPLSRREALKQLGVVGAGLAIGSRRIVRSGANEIVIAGQPVEIAIASLSRITARITLRPINNGAADTLPVTGELISEKLGQSIARSRAAASVSRVRAGDLVVKFTEAPPTLTVETRSGAIVQRLVLDAASPGMSFLLGDGPLLGLGEGGPQFDRKGSVDRMIIGQGGYRLSTHGTRAPIPWLVGTDGWAMFVHQPTGEFDFTGGLGRFTPKEAALPLDVFVVASKNPAVIMREYARITGLPEM